MNNTSEMVTLSVIALNWVDPVKMVGFWNGQKTKFMKIILSPGVPYLQILVILGHESYIEALYGSWTTHRCKKISKQTTRAGVTRGWL